MDRDWNPNVGDIKCTLQVEAVARDGAVSRGDLRQGLSLETVEGGTHLGQGDPRETGKEVRRGRQSGGG